jgi:hypothetical protein
MVFRKETQADLKQELIRLKGERAQLDETIAALEIIVTSTRAQSNGSSQISIGQREPLGERPIRSKHSARGRIRSTHYIAAVLRQAGTPLSPGEVATLVLERGKRLEYGVIYQALRKSPLFARSGKKWILKDAVQQIVPVQSHEHVGAS